MGKSNKRVSVKSNRRGTPRVKNRDSNEATGITVEEVLEKIQQVLVPAPAVARSPTVEMKPKKTKKKEIV